jgi:predicted Zn-dependent peptidase
VTRSKKELEQVHLALAVRGFAQADEDRYAGHVLNTVLGGSLSSRLFQNVREKRGLVYSISSGVATYSDAGMLTVYAGTGVEKLDEVIRLSVEEMRRLRDEPLGAEELRRARDHLKGGIVLSLESTASRMSHLARQEIAFGRQLSFEEIMEGIEAVTPEAVQRMGARMFTGTLALSVLGRLGRWRPRPSVLRL